MTKTERWRRDYEVLKANPDRWERHKAVVRERNRRRYKADPEFRAKHQQASCASQRQLIRDPIGWSKRMVVRLRYKSRKNGIPFDITVADIPVPTHCPVFGTELILGGVDGYKDWNSPSVDRIVPDLGYVKGNVRVISARANTIKNNATSAELRLLADYVDAHK